MGPCDSSSHGLFICIYRPAHSVRPKAALHYDTGVVKSDLSGNTAKKPDRSGQSIQKAFQVLTIIHHDKGSTAVAQSGAEQVHCHTLTTEVNSSPAPVYLHGRARNKSQRHIGFHSSALCFHLVHCFANEGFTTGIAAFLNQPVVNPSGRMMLLAGTFLLICVQAMLKESDYLWRQYGIFPLIGLSVSRYCVTFQILPYGIS